MWKEPQVFKTGNCHVFYDKAERTWGIWIRSELVLDSSHFPSRYSASWEPSLVGTSDSQLCASLGWAFRWISFHRIRDEGSKRMESQSSLNPNTLLTCLFFHNNQLAYILHHVKISQFILSMLCTLRSLSSSHAFVAAHVKLLIRDRIFIINLFQIQILGGVCADELPQI